jgi:hypothetical protein
MKEKNMSRKSTSPSKIEVIEEIEVPLVNEFISDSKPTIYSESEKVFSDFFSELGGKWEIIGETKCLMFQIGLSKQYRIIQCRQCLDEEFKGKLNIQVLQELHFTQSQWFRTTNKFEYDENIEEKINDQIKELETHWNNLGYRTIND